MNGELVDWADAKVHVGVHGLHYGSGVFEGIRCYETPSGPAVFRLDDHMKRLANSAKLLYMDLPYSVQELREATFELIGANVIPHVAKATGVYLNSMLAVTEANRAGYDEAILLTAEGTVADGSGENIFVIRDGEIFTPALSTSILPGITRDAVIQIAQDLGYSVTETNIIRSDLYLADEVFMCGTAAEVTPLRSIDDHELGVGPITLELQGAYLDTVRGRSERWAQWLDLVVPAPTQA
jgi:branched-chain amino acid aminotransferase